MAEHASDFTSPRITLRVGLGERDGSLFSHFYNLVAISCSTNWILIDTIVFIPHERREFLFYAALIFFVCGFLVFFILGFMVGRRSKNPILLKANADAIWLAKTTTPDQVIRSVTCDKVRNVRMMDSGFRVSIEIRLKDGSRIKRIACSSEESVIEAHGKELASLLEVPLLDFKGQEVALP